MALTSSSIKRLKSTPCYGSTLHKVSGFARTREGGFRQAGHLLQVSLRERGFGGNGIVWCTRCGAYGEKVARCVLRRCRGVASRTGKWVIGKFEKNQHPIDGGRLRRPFAYLPAGVPAEVEGRKRPRDKSEAGGPPRQDGACEEEETPRGTGGDVGRGAVAQGPEVWEVEQEREEMWEGIGGLEAFEEPPTLEQIEEAERGGRSISGCGEVATGGTRVRVRPVGEAMGAGRGAGPAEAEIPAPVGQRKRTRAGEEATAVVEDKVAEGQAGSARSAKRSRFRF